MDKSSNDPASGFPPLMDLDYPQIVANHVDKSVGIHSDLFHEALSVDLHLDVLMVPPGRNRNWFTLVTCGMGLYEMEGPPESGPDSRMELAICLPPDWPPFHRADSLLGGENAEGRRPVEGLRFTDLNPPVTPYGPGTWIMWQLNWLAKAPIRHNLWFDEGHTIPNGEQAESYFPGTGLCCALLARPRRIANPDFHRLRLADGSQVRFMSLILIHRTEMDFKLRRGHEALFDRFDERGVDELLDINRPSVCRGGLLGYLGF